MPDCFVFSCEHGGNRVPGRYRAAFAGRESLLNTHRGYDRGALPLARRLARAFDAPLVASTVTRLLVDLNRSEGHAHLHHPAVGRLPRDERSRILARYYHPHRERLERLIVQRSRRGRVVHIGVHSFTPRRRGVTRTAEIGLLYDPARRDEAKWCDAWREALRRLAPRRWRIRMNYPYRGSDDGLTTALRRRFDPHRYLGLELEVNRRLLGDHRLVADLVAASLRLVSGREAPAHLPGRG